MKIIVQVLVSICFPFVLSSQIWKYPSSAYQYHHKINLNHDINSKKGVKIMSIKVFTENDTLSAYTKYDKSGRVIEYKSEYDIDTTFYFYEKSQLWSSVRLGHTGKITTRQILYENDTISSIHTNFLNGKDISKFYYDSSVNLIKAIHNDSIVEEFIYSNNKLITYFKSVKGVVKDKMDFSYSGDTVFYSYYIFPNNKEKLIEETYGVFKDKNLILINTKTNYGGNTPSVVRYKFKDNKRGKILESWEEYSSNQNNFEEGKFKEVFTYNKKGNLEKRELISKNEKPRILCQYFYIYY